MVVGDGDSIVLIKIWNNLIERVDVPPMGTYVIVTCVDIKPWNGKHEGSISACTKIVVSF